MSKSLGNTVAITDPPEEMYGRIMSVSDALMLDWLELLSDGAWNDLLEARARVAAGAGDPLGLKHDLARRLVGRFHGSEAAEGAQAAFRRVVQGKAVPEDLPERALPSREGGERGLLEVLEALELVSSRSEARRLIGQSAVSIDGQSENDPLRRLGVGSYLIRVGKRRFARVRID
jgi:tyrosyl-tRNA synthetase